MADERITDRIEPEDWPAEGPHPSSAMPWSLSRQLLDAFPSGPAKVALHTGPPGLRVMAHTVDEQGRAICTGEPADAGAWAGTVTIEQCPACYNIIRHGGLADMADE